jgi:hypothetical protein
VLVAETLSVAVPDGFDQPFRLLESDHFIRNRVGGEYPRIGSERPNAAVRPVDDRRFAFARKNVRWMKIEVADRFWRFL